MKIWLCIPVFNRIEYTLKCLASLESQTYRNFAVVICDHGSSDGTSEAIKQQFPSTILLTGDSSMWWTAAINLCVRYALDHAGDSDFILTLNNDTELPSDYLQQLISCESKYPGNIVTSVIHDITDGKLVDIGYRQNWWLATGKSVNFADHHLPNDGDVIEISHASGRGTLFPIIVFRRIGLYDERRLPHYAADYDFTFKAGRAGYKIYVCKNCRVLSHIQATGMTEVLSGLSFRTLLNYFTGMRSPANLSARFWYGWNNCPSMVMPVYFLLDLIRVSGSYFKHFTFNK